MRGGNDVLNYTSNQDVNAALPQLEFLMGEGNDRANVEATVNGTPSRSRGFGFVTMGGPGNDVLMTKITTLTTSDNPTEPVVHGEQHGGGGRDELTLISTTATGGFTLTSKELTPSTDGTVTQPGCLIWDLVDGSSGIVNAQVMGSEVDEQIELRSDARGIGRSHFDFAMDGGGGVNALDAYLTFEAETQGDVNGSCQMSNGAEQGWEIDGILELSASTSTRASNNEGPIAESRFGISIDGVQSAATLELLGSNGDDDVNVNVRESRVVELTVVVYAPGGQDSATLTAGDPGELESNKLFVGGLSWNTSDIETLEFQLFAGDLSINFTGLEVTSDATETDMMVVYSRTGLVANATGYDQVDLDLDLTAANTRVEIGLLLPAVQKVRAAAARMNVRSVALGTRSWSTPKVIRTSMGISISGAPTPAFRLGCCFRRSRRSGPPRHAWTCGASVPGTRSGRRPRLSELRWGFRSPGPRHPAGSGAHHSHSQRRNITTRPGSD